MVFLSVADCKRGRFFSLELLLLAASYYYVPIAKGQQVGVTLKLQGVTIPNNSLVEIDDILYTSPIYESPINDNGLHDQTLVCETDLVDCCDAPHTVRGNWYHPDGNIVTSIARSAFRSNRGPNEVINGRQFNGSVRIYRYYTPPNRGRFRCELPSAANPSVNQILYANIVNFGADFRVPPVTISPSGSTGTAGETYSLMCSTTLHSDSTPLPSDVPSPTFEWFFGPNNSSLPSGVIMTPLGTVFENGNTYTSTLQFSRLSQSVHAGMYTCRIGAGRLANRAMVAVNAPAISVQISPSGAPVFGQNGYSLICSVNGAENLNPSITYQWTKNNTTQTQMHVSTNSTTLSFSPLRPSVAGGYTCSVTVRSAYLSSVARASSQPFILNISIPGTAVSLHSDSSSPILSGSSPTLSCTLEMSSTANVPVTVNMAWEGPNGTVIMPTTTPEMASFTLYTLLNTLNSIKQEDSGEYTCIVSFENGVEMPASTNITIVDGVFQLRLKSVGICHQWYDENSEQYSNFIKVALVKAIERQCKCHFPIINLLNDDVFFCEDSPNQMTYRNTLLGTHNFNGTQIIGFIQDWVTSGPLIKIRGSYVRVDSSCPVAIPSLDEPECGQGKEDRLCDDDPQYAMCAEHLKDKNVANCFEGCVIRNRS